MLAKTAFDALKRIADGEPAFAEPLTGKDGYRVRTARREAIDLLYSRAYIKRTPFGPIATKRGRAVLDALKRARSTQELVQALGYDDTEQMSEALGMSAANIRNYSRLCRDLSK